MPAAWSCAYPPQLDLLQLHAAWPDRYPFLLQSCAGGRYDLLLAFPGETVTVRERAAVGGFFERFDRTHDRREPNGPDVPFRSGWFVYLGYEAGTALEDGVPWPAMAPAYPCALAVRVSVAIIRDRKTGTLTVTHGHGAEDQAAQARKDVNEVPALTRAAVTIEPVSEDPERHFLDGVARVRDYIRAGDVYQVNLSRAWRTRSPATPADVYAALRAANPAPFAACVRLDGDTTIISSSPERLVRTGGRVIETRPIAGTYPRGRDLGDDTRLSRELLAHPKERAEHVMLIDLERNDLGRVCVPGTVRVAELMALESYAHVHHIVSQVTGELRPGVGPGTALRAVFPGGTITGCPKVRCMQIINELEREARGAYTGSLGYIDDDGRMDFNILIRTIVQRGEELSWRAGAGIVADSDPARELAETRAKALGLMRALGAA